MIKELDTGCNPAAGPDDVPVALLKNASVELAKPLNILFNHSINMGHVPPTWKEAAVVPIYKGGELPAHLSNVYHNESFGKDHP